MKRLGFISPLLACANCLGSWESVAMAVESLFMGGAARFWRLGDRLSQAQSAEINDNFGYGSIELHSSEPRTQLDSGRYRYKTVPLSG